MTPETLPALLSAFISLEDLAATLGVTKPTFGAWRRERQLPAIRLGARTYFHLPSVAAWLALRRQNQQPPVRVSRLWVGLSGASPLAARVWVAKRT